MPPYRPYCCCHLKRAHSDSINFLTFLDKCTLSFNEISISPFSTHLLALSTRLLTITSPTNNHGREESRRHQNRCHGGAQSCVSTPYKHSAQTQKQAQRNFLPWWPFETIQRTNTQKQAHSWCSVYFPCTWMGS